MSSVFPITDDPRYRRITASAGQTVFSIGFPFLQNEDIGIYLQTAPSQYTLFSPSAYTLTGANNPAGGSATFLAPRSAGDIILILGAAVLDRMSSIVRDGKFSSALTDGELDRIRIIQQEFSRDADRAIKVDYGGEGVTLASNLADGDVLMKQGNRLVPGPNAPDIANAQEYAYDALQSKQAAAGSASSAAGSATMAGRWANEAEDAPVAGGLYSAFHWAKKAMAAVTGMLAKAGGTLTGDVLFGPGTGGKYSKLQANGDVQLNRGDNTGYLTWNVANAYFGYDGNRYGLGPAGDLVIGKGILQVEKNGLIAQFYETGDIVFSGGVAGEFGNKLSDVLRGYTSAQQTFALGGSLVVAHGLGRVPKRVFLAFVFKVAAGGYAVGDRVIVGPNTAGADVNYRGGWGTSVNVDATNIRVNFGGDGIPLVTKGGGGVGYYGQSQLDVVVMGSV
ncbi:hypothetical protein [Agrobacterium sp. 22117]|uniref:hypothetical protein n=1 Tax=Agrobacterium sp. 22117 TaxID=3453880 RepID=UPI003F8575C0